MRLCRLIHTLSIIAIYTSIVALEVPMCRQHRKCMTNESRNKRGIYISTGEIEWRKQRSRIWMLCVKMSISESKSRADTNWFRVNILSSSVSSRKGSVARFNVFYSRPLHHLQFPRTLFYDCNGFDIKCHVTSSHRSLYIFRMCFDSTSSAEL